jgi:hypothetical protein
MRERLEPVIDGVPAGFQADGMDLALGRVDAAGVPELQAPEYNLSPDTALFRRVLVVWGHWCGRATPGVARAFREEFPNLSCDLGASHRSARYGREKIPLVRPAGRLEPAWRAVIETVPERLLPAIDPVDPGHDDRYVGWVQELGQALAELPPEVSRRVAFGNAEATLGRRTDGS